MNNDIIIIKKLDYILTKKQETALTTVYEDQIEWDGEILKELWEKEMSSVINTLKTGCVTSRRSTNLKSIKGKWYNINYFNETFGLKEGIQTLLDINMFDDEICDENDVNMLLIKFVNGVATEFRYNEELFELLEPELEVDEDMNEYNQLIKCMTLNEYNRYKKIEKETIKIRKIYFGAKRLRDISNIDYIPVNLLEKLVYFFITQDRNGSWHTPELYLEASRSKDDIFEYIDNLEFDEDANQTELFCLLVKYEFGIMKALRCNDLYWKEDKDRREDGMVDREVETEDYIEKSKNEDEQYDSEIFTNFDFYQEMVNESVASSNVTLKGGYEHWNPRYEEAVEKENVDTNFTLKGCVYDIWTSEYETEEVVEKTSLWGSFKDVVSRVWTGLKNCFFGW